MPTPRQHGGAAVAYFPLTTPGFRGLNTQALGALLGPEWATRLENTVIDSNGRIAARKGWNLQTTVAASEAFVSGVEYTKTDGTTSLILTSATKVWSSTDQGGTFSDITGSASFTSGDWYLQNFHDFVVGFQEGKRLLASDGATSSIVADTNCPTGGIGVAAFGRVWKSATDGHTIKYSALLDHTNWTTSDAGSIDMSSIWLNNDHITAITAFNNLLIVFGTRNIAVWSDGTGSDLGIDPAQMQIIDTIPGIGCLHQRSVALVQGDVWFVANNRELMSMQRLIVEQKSGNISTLSIHVSDFLRDSINSGSFDTDNIRSAYSPSDRFYLLSLPVTSAPGVTDEVGHVFVFDTRGQMEDGSARCLGIWNQLVPTVIIPQLDGHMFMALKVKTGQLGLYSQHQDDTSDYTMIYESGWFEVVDKSGYEIILKRINGQFFFDLTTTVLMKWAFDFDTRFRTKQIQWVTTGGSAQWGISEWGYPTPPNEPAEWGGGIDLSQKHVMGRGTGQYIKIGFEADISGGSFAIQELNLFGKVGRLKG